MRSHGTVEWFSEPKGYGYLAAEDGTEVYVAHDEIRGEGFRTLHAGQQVSFVMDDDGRGPCAVDVAPVLQGSRAEQRSEGRRVDAG